MRAIFIAFERPSLIDARKCISKFGLKSRHYLLES
jgi:hypothetical protein